MENNNNHDSYFREMLSGSSREMPFTDFEDDLMEEIRTEHEKNNSFIKNIKISWLFFFIGMISGMTIVILAPGLADSSNDSSDILIYAAIIFICLFILLFAEQLFRISFRRNI